MTFKKSLENNNREKKSSCGQAALEYFIITAIIAALTLLSLNADFISNIRDSLNTGVFQQAVSRIAPECAAN